MTVPLAKLKRRLMKAQEQAHRRPLLYAARVLAFVAIGYAYLALLVAMLLASVASLVVVIWYLAWQRGEYRGALWLAIFLIPALGGLILGVIDALRVEIPAPEGIILRRRDAPVLFEEIEDLKRQLKVRRIDRVLLTEQCNAAVAVIPRLAGVAGARHYLLLGLPLMQSLPPEAFRGVIAHELGHVSGHVNRLQQFLYKYEQRWIRLYSGVSASSALGTILLVWFLVWYVPRLQMLVFTMRRALEFEADRLAARIMGTDTYARALAMGATRTDYLHGQFWSSVFERVRTQVQPDDDIYFQLRRSLTEGIAAPLQLGWLRRSLAHLPDFRQTHPTLSERLAAVGIANLPADSTEELSQLLNAVPQQTAAEHYLGDSEEELTRILSLKWKSAQAPYWRDEYNNAAVRESYLEELRRRKRRGEMLDPDEQIMICRLTEEFDGRRGAFGLYKQYLEDHRDNPRASFAFGRILVEEDDERGIPYIEYAMEADAFFTPEGCRAITDYLYRHGRHPEARRHEERAAAFERDFAEARDERLFVEPGDEFEPAELGEKERLSLCRKLRLVEEVTRAWIVRKKVVHFPEKLVYVLGVEVRHPRAWDAETRRRFADWMDFGHDLIVVVARGDERRVLRRIKRLDGAMIFCPKMGTEPAETTGMERTE